MRARSFTRVDVLFGVTVPLIVLAVWLALIKFGQIPAYLLPSPKAVFSAALNPANELAPQAGRTALEALSGFLIANVLALVGAVAFVHSKRLQRAVFPYAIALKTTPIVALAPILVVWFGTGMWSKIASAALVSFFPVLVGATDGLRAVDVAALDLFRSLRASPIQVLRLLRFPSAQEHIFPALKVSSSLSVVGAIVGEFVSPEFGLGRILTRSSYQLATDTVFAAIFASAAIGVVFFGIISIIERRSLRWRYLERGDLA